ncbi:MAG: acetyl-coenzyme A synthetase N-terminal domain-containing protein, partial [Pseudomonadota bacterium]|nr:acetyl-coenzyme A synthetase N-terminal domain-containing protein [Pseudomonadota bacterium]
MTKDIYKVPDNIKSNSLMTNDEYKNLYNKSIENPEKFWSDQAHKYLDWDSEWTNVKHEDFLKGE